MWLRKGGAAEFFRDKNVNVVLPLAGPGSFYADWQRDDPKLGRYKWETFLTQELPPLIDEEFDGFVRKLITYMMEDPRTISSSLDLLFLAKAIERIGDHSKNVAELIIYLVEGKDVRHQTMDAIESALL